MEVKKTNNESGAIKKYLPAAALLIVTVLVMVYFKATQDSGYNIFDQGESLLERFYSKNLKPMFQSEDQLSNEDLINFAFNNNLPVSDDKVLFISEFPGQEREIGIKDAVLNKKTNNYEKFIKHYCKDDVSRKRIDSILDSYREELSVSVLTSENEAIAVDENILKLNYALQAELLECATKSTGFNKIHKDKYDLFKINKDRLAAFRAQRDKQQDKKLVFLTPDTVFTKNYRFNTKEIASLIKEAEEPEIEEKFEKLLVPVMNETPSAEAVPLKNFTVGKQKISAVYDAKEMGLISLRDSLMKLRVALKEMKQGNFGGIKFEYESDSESVNFELNFDDLGEFIFKALEAVDDQSAKNWEEFGLKIDSAATVFEQTVMDSIIKMSIKKNKPDKKKIRKKKNKKSE